MHIKKVGKILLGVELSKEERKAMEIEIRKETAEILRKTQNEIDAMILWELREQFDFGPTRLRRFFNNFAPGVDALVKKYEMGDEDIEYLCTKKLLDVGIDIEEWEREQLKDRAERG